MGAFIGMLLAVVAVLLVRGPDNNTPSTNPLETEALAPLTPTPTPRASVTSSAAAAAGTPGLFVTGTPATPTPRATQAATGPTDLVAIGATLLPDGRVSVTIGNRGPGDVTTQPIFVSVRDLTLRGEQL